MDLESIDRQDQYFTSGDHNSRSRQPQRPRLPYKNMSLITVSNNNRAAVWLEDQARASLTLHQPLSAQFRDRFLLSDVLNFLDKVEVSE